MDSGESRKIFWICLMPLNSHFKMTEMTNFINILQWLKQNSHEINYSSRMTSWGTSSPPSVVLVPKTEGRFSLHSHRLSSWWPHTHLISLFYQEFWRLIQHLLVPGLGTHTYDFHHGGWADLFQGEIHTPRPTSPHECVFQPPTFNGYMFS